MTHHSTKPDPQAIKNIFSELNYVNGLLKTFKARNEASQNHFAFHKKPRILKNPYVSAPYKFRNNHYEWSKYKYCKNSSAPNSSNILAANNTLKSTFNVELPCKRKLPEDFIIGVNQAIKAVTVSNNDKSCANVVSGTSTANCKTESENSEGILHVPSIELVVSTSEDGNFDSSSDELKSVQNMCNALTEHNEKCINQNDSTSRIPMSNSAVGADKASNELKIVNKKLHTASLLNKHNEFCNAPPKRIVNSKYKVVNKNTNPNKIVDKSLINSSAASSHFLNNTNELMKTKVSKPSSLKALQDRRKVVQTAYKIVNRKKSLPENGLNIGKLKTPEARKLLVQRISPLTKLQANKLHNINCGNAKVNARCEQIISNLSKQNVGSLKHAESHAVTSLKLPLSERNSGNLLKNKLKMGHVQDFDLADVSPEELVALDHGTLLKLCAIVKQPSKSKRKSFIKKTKYKIVSKKFSANKIKQPWMSHSQKGGSYLLRDQRNMNSYLTARRLLASSRKSRYVGGFKKTMINRNTTYKMCSLKMEKTASLKHSDVVTPSSARSLASRVLQRSIQTAVAASVKKTRQQNAYCMFYNRFGKCNRGSQCPYLHDPSKIAVCTRFLRGTCKLKNCAFSHEKNPGKMAICTYFLQGICNVKDCPYQHQMVAPNAEACQDFIQGYCAAADKCQKAHILVCPFYARGNCPKGSSCTYPHPPRKERKTEAVSAVVEKESIAEENREEARYFSHSELEIGDGSTFINRHSWAGQEAPNLPNYIPLSFHDGDFLV